MYAFLSHLPQPACILHYDSSIEDEINFRIVDVNKRFEKLLISKQKILIDKLSFSKDLLKHDDNVAFLEAVKSAFCSSLDAAAFEPVCMKGCKTLTLCKPDECNI
jgi:hypothetical protein